MLICSPWTTGGYIDSNVHDHTSMLQFLAAWTGVKPANVTSWRSSVVGDLTAAFDFANPDYTIPANIPTLAQTWALTQLTGGSTTPPAEGDQSMPSQESGTRPHRPSNLQPFADVAVNRSTSVVTATLANTGSVGLSFAVYPNAYLSATPTPVTVAASSAGSYTWDAADTSGDYNFSVYGPDGFLTTFKGAVVAASTTTGQIPLVTATLDTATTTITLTLSNDGTEAIGYTLTPSEYEGTTQTVTVDGGDSAAVSWPTDAYGYYDVIITANTSDDFTRRYAGRVA
jgi:phospholipase C